LRRSITIHPSSGGSMPSGLPCVQGAGSLFVAALQAAPWQPRLSEAPAHRFALGRLRFAQPEPSGWRVNRHGRQWKALLPGLVLASST